MTIETKAIAAIALVVVVTCGFLALRNHYIEVGEKKVQVKWNQAKEAQNAENVRLIAQATKEYAELKDRQIKTSQLVLSEYEKSLVEKNDKITADRKRVDADRLRFRANIVCAAPAGQAIASSAGNANGEREATIELPIAIERNLRGLAENAEREIARKDTKIHALQEFIIQNGMYEGPR